MKHSTMMYLYEYHRNNLKSAASAVRPALPALAILGFQFVAVTSAYGQGTEVWTKTANSVLSEVNNILRPISVLAIIVMGVAASFGKMEWGTVGKVAAGIIIANGATTIVDYLQSNGGGSTS